MAWASSLPLLLSATHLLCTHTASAISSDQLQAESESKALLQMSGSQCAGVSGCVLRFCCRHACMCFSGPSHLCLWMDGFSVVPYAAWLLAFLFGDNAWSFCHSTSSHRLMLNSVGKGLQQGFSSCPHQSGAPAKCSGVSCRACEHEVVMQINVWCHFIPSSTDCSHTYQWS